MTANTHARPSFEESYPEAPFAELIRLALTLAETLVKLRSRLTESTPVAPRQHA